MAKSKAKLKVIQELSLTGIISGQALELPDCVALFLTEEVNGYAMWRKDRSSVFHLIAFFQGKKRDLAMAAFYMKARVWKRKERFFKDEHGSP